MISIDLSGKVALITGGTKGIGLGSALKLGEAGARCVLTYRWGSADEAELFERFEAVGAPRPLLVGADVANDEDIEALMDAIGESHEGVDFFVSNVAFAARTPTLASYKKRSLFKSLEYSTWPLVSHVEAIHKRFGRYPAYVLGISSDGADRSYPGYDFVAASKSVLEVFARYMGSHLREEGTRVNVLRFGMVATESFEAMFGEEFWTFLEGEGIKRSDLLSPEECGEAVLAMCSGLFDAMQSQVITLDRAMAFEDNMMRRFERWKVAKTSA
ncbi:SDR family oxidoreductase [Lujinxingia litoralis]|uniref:SDR family oxidoreductase n=1 Tax=Lujinxingia litoralis TaxID=2211119 RepID=UPI001314B190|nr:SDR family oxidoreductase [Lujinxingia litoralis]